MCFQLPQKIRRLRVRKAVMCVVHVGVLPEECIGLVEEQYRAGALGEVEDPIEVLLGLADVARDDRREIDTKDGYACGLA